MIPVLIQHIIDYLSSAIGVIYLIILFYIKIRYNRLFVEIKNSLKYKFKYILITLILFTILTYLIYPKETLENIIYFTLEVSTIVMISYFFILTIKTINKSKK